MGRADEYKTCLTKFNPSKSVSKKGKVKVNVRPVLASLAQVKVEVKSKSYIIWYSYKYGPACDGGLSFVFMK